MSDISTYTAVLDVGEGRTLSGLLASFDDHVRPGCFARTISERGASGRIKLVADLPKGRPLVLGAATQMRETDQGLHAVFDVSEGQAGDLILERRQVPCTVRTQQIGNEFKLVDVRLGHPKVESPTRAADQRRISIDVARRRLALWDMVAGQ